MTYSALFCSVVNKNLCLTPLQYEVPTLTRAQRGEARQGAHTQHHAAFIGSTGSFLGYKNTLKNYLFGLLGGAGGGRLLYTLIYDFATQDFWGFFLARPLAVGCLEMLVPAF